MSKRAVGWAKLIAVLVLGLALEVPAASLPGQDPHRVNPILPGYFADPSFVSFKGRDYLFATIDPWGGETLGCWESEDFKSWTYRLLNWPTKRACTSPTSKPNMVWAPSVVRAPNGRFYMYISVGSEVWVGTAAKPLGPWRDALGGKPLIPENFRPGFHMIDAEAFVDNDGSAYLYWGSGWNWVNGKCWAVRLNSDMISFQGEVKDVTPANYFEGPFMLKHANRYYLMYSNGKTIEDTYQVHYAIGTTPLGPFVEATNSPILVTDLPQNIRAPGHHAVFSRGGKHYILYHRHSIPFDPDFIGRQICVDELRFTNDGLIEEVKPTHAAPEWVQRAVALGKGPSDTGAGVRVTASGQRNPNTPPGFVADDNFATLWAAGTNGGAAWIQMDLGETRRFTRQELRFEYAWKFYRFKVESSMDGQAWKPVADYSEQPATGSPFVISARGKARYLRLAFVPGKETAEPGLFEWRAR